MEFLRVRTFGKAHKPNPKNHLDDKPVSHPEEPKNDTLMNNDLGKLVSADPATDAEENDDDFIMNEVKRRLKELRRNNFMVMIPEESCPEGVVEQDDGDDKEEGETNSSEWRDVEAERRQLWSSLDAFFEKYCERMLSFDRLTAQQLKEIGPNNPSTPSPRSVSTLVLVFEKD